MHEAYRAAMRHHLDQDVAQRRTDCGRGRRGRDPELGHVQLQLRESATTYSQGELVSLAKVTSIGVPKPRQSPAFSSWRSLPSIRTRLPRCTQTIWRMWA